MKRPIGTDDQHRDEADVERAPEQRDAAQARTRRGSSATRSGRRRSRWTGYMVKKSKRLGHASTRRCRRSSGWRWTRRAIRSPRITCSTRLRARKSACARADAPRRGPRRQAMSDQDGAPGGAPCGKLAVVLRGGQHLRATLRTRARRRPRPACRARCEVRCGSLGLVFGHRARRDRGVEAAGDAAHIGHGQFAGGVVGDKRVGQDSRRSGVRSPSAARSARRASTASAGIRHRQTRRTSRSSPAGNADGAGLPPTEARARWRESTKPATARTAITAKSIRTDIANPAEGQLAGSAEGGGAREGPARFGQTYSSGPIGVPAATACLGRGQFRVGHEAVGGQRAIRAGHVVGHEELDVFLQARDHADDGPS